MSVTREEIDRFHDFAVSVVSGEEPGLTWRQLFEMWQMEHPSSAEHRENVAAIRESLDAMDVGRTRPLANFDVEFRSRHGISSGS